MFLPESVKKMILKKFLLTAREKGIKYMELDLTGDEIKFKPLPDNYTVINREDYEALKTVILSHPDNLARELFKRILLPKN